MSIFKSSAAEFKNLKSIVTAALLIALHTVFAVFVSVQVTQSLRISIAFVINVVIGCLYGPVMGLVCGALGDIVQFVIKPTGPYFPGWTLSAALACFIYGIAFYKRFPRKIKEIEAQDTDNSTKKRPNTVFKVLRAALLAASAILMVFAPFVSVSAGGEGETFSGTGIAYIIRLFGSTGSAALNASIVAALFFAMITILLVLCFTRFNVASLIISILVTFAGLLAIYTDKKTTSPQWGFIAVTALLIIYMLIMIIGMYRTEKLDVPFLARTVAALAIDTVLVNILLGTYWVSVMYGKGFAFYLTSRLVKNLLQLPVNVVLSYYVLAFVRDIRSKTGLLR